MERCDTAWLEDNLADTFTFNGHFPPFTREAFIKGQQGIIQAFDGWRYTLQNIEQRDQVILGQLCITGRHARALQLPSAAIAPFAPAFREVRTAPQRFEVYFEQQKIVKLWTEMAKGKGMREVLRQLDIVLDTFEHES
ncbi:hypothetical protein [Ohtaekwangia sp.]|uniref:hypothetical protein n=1 Tax=Ohtaekwangia sp. TaxID=2066019 RepID=UPI002F936C40